jgi:hypothetical protein
VLTLRQDRRRKNTLLRSVTDSSRPWERCAHPRREDSVFAKCRDLGELPHLHVVVIMIIYFFLGGHNFAQPCVKKAITNLFDCAK